MKENEFIDSVSNIEPDVLERFIFMDNKLQEKANKQKSKGIRLRFGAIAACFCLIVIAIVIVPMLRENDPGVIPGPGTTDDPINDLPTKDISFDSLDKVNFYGGLKAIADSTENLSVTNTNSQSVAYLSGNPKSSVQILNLSGISSDNIPGPESADNSGIMNPYNVMWDLTDEQMTINTAVYFKINVTENDALLASEIGVGKAEVIVTDLCIGINPFAMITFKNDDRFFSCLSQMYALKNGENQFSSNLCIRGFEMFKDPVGEMTMFFNLVLDNNNKTIERFYWKPFNRIPSEAAIHEIEVFPKTIYISNDTYEFTLNELSSYWQNENNIPTMPEGETLSPPPGPPEIYDDGMLRYYLVDNEYYEVAGIYNSYYTDITIPDNLFEYPIKGIQSYAFRNYKYLKSVVIPDSIEYIGDYAFSDCDNLTSINMPDNVRLGIGAFGTGDETIPDTDETLSPNESNNNPSSDSIDQSSSWKIIRSDGVKLIIDEPEFREILSLCENLHGEYAGSSKGHYGVLYSIYYTDENGRTDIYSLWDETTYTHGFVAFIGQSMYIYPDFMKDTNVNDILLMLDNLYKEAGYW